MTLSTNGCFAAARALVLAATVAAGACGRQAGETASSSGAPAAGAGTPAAQSSARVAPRALVEVTNQAAALKVQVIDAQRISADTLRIDLALTNTSQAPEPLDVVRALGASAAPDAAPFTPADMCLLTPEGSRRLFVLRDEGNKPVTGGGFEPLRPGERRVVWAVFPSPSAEATRVNLLVAGTLLRDVPVSPAPQATAAPGTPPTS